MIHRKCVAHIGLISAIAMSAIDAQVKSQYSLQDTIQEALQNNFDIQIENIAYYNAQDGITAAQAEFDPEFFFSSRYEDLDRRQNLIDFSSTNNPNSNRIFLENNWRFNSGIGGNLITGGRYELSASMSELNNTLTTTSLSSLFDPEYESFFGLTLSQPLLKNFGTDTSRAGIRLAQIQLSVTEYGRQIMVNNKVVEVVNAYYDLVFGQENLLVKDEAVKVAEQLVSENQRRVDAGRMRPLDVSQAKVRLSEAQEEHILAQDFLRDRRNTLLKLILSEAPESSEPTFEVESNLTKDLPSFDPSQQLDTALDIRPDYLLAQAESKREDLRYKYARNQTLPELNVEFTYGLSGLENSYGNSVDRAFNGGEAQWSAGLVFRIPFGNRRAEAEKRSAKRLKARAELSLSKLELEMSIDIRNAISRLETLKQRLQTARDSLSLAEEALQAEIKLMDSGKSTSFNVIELQEKVSDSKSRVIAGQIDLLKAANEVRAFSGELLQSQGFVLQDPTDPLPAEKKWIKWHDNPISLPDWGIELPEVKWHSLPKLW